MLLRLTLIYLHEIVKKLNIPKKARGLNFGNCWSTWLAFFWSRSMN